jgi:hypothetical protein
MACKWIVNNNELIIGNVEFHFDLLGSNRKKEQTAGGGMWFIDRRRKITYFWGESQDFGNVTQETFQLAINNSMISPFIEETTIYFSNDLLLPVVVGKVGRGELKPITITPNHPDSDVATKFIKHEPKETQQHLNVLKSRSSWPDSKPHIRSAPKVGRNEPCPCKSGKKFKQCCLK